MTSAITPTSIPSSFGVNTPGAKPPAKDDPLANKETFLQLLVAQIKNQKSYCYSIKASDIKNQCLAILK